MKKRLFGFVLLASVAAIAGIGSYQWIQSNAGNIADTRIDFELTDLDGKLRRASEWDGQIVLVNFWAPWCAPCRAEIPLLIDLQNRYAEQGLQVLGPALDNPEAVIRFARDFGINYPLFTDLNAVLDLQEAYGDTRLPYTVLLNQQGKVVYRHAGELKKDDIEAQLNLLLPP